MSSAPTVIPADTEYESKLRELKQVKEQIAELEKRKDELTYDLFVAYNVGDKVEWVDVDGERRQSVVEQHHTYTYDVEGLRDALPEYVIDPLLKPQAIASTAFQEAVQAGYIPLDIVDRYVTITPKKPFIKFITPAKGHNISEGDTK